MNQIPFNKPHLTGNEGAYLAEAIAGRLAGDGPFTERCQHWLCNFSKAPKALLMHSCTAALEAAALMIDLQPGDEVIMPSFTFVSTANAVALRGAVPVFVDIRADTLNLDENLVEGAITTRTKAIIPIHYGGAACSMKELCELAEPYKIPIIEDAAQALGSSLHGRALGTWGTLGAISFHETKNVGCGEGGALYVNDTGLSSLAEIVREKGTDRAQYVRGQVDKYTWREIGSSYLPSELNAAFLLAQLEQAEQLNAKRLAIWNEYYKLTAPLEERERARRPVIPDNSCHNGHLFYLILNENIDRESVLTELSECGVEATSHYEPLHGTPGAKRCGAKTGALGITESSAAQLIRLPLWVGLTTDQQAYIVEQLTRILG